MDQLPDSPATSIFRTVKRETSLTAQVADELVDIIIKGHLKTGDRLPPERELAERFGVSRTVIREAVRSLAAKGLLDVRSGSGTVVTTPDAGAVSESLALFLRGQMAPGFGEVLEVRRVLEIEIAGLAAARRTDVDIADLETNIGTFETTMDMTDFDLYIQTDVAFHSLLARATHNPLFDMLVGSLTEVLMEVRLALSAVPGSRRKAYSHHKRIMEQVRAGDIEGAREAMRRHLLESEETRRQAILLHEQKAHNSPA